MVSSPSESYGLDSINAQFSNFCFERYVSHDSHMVACGIKESSIDTPCARTVRHDITDLSFPPVLVIASSLFSQHSAFDPAVFSNTITVPPAITNGQNVTYQLTSVGVHHDRIHFVAWFRENGSWIYSDDMTDPKAPHFLTRTNWPSLNTEKSQQVEFLLYRKM